MKQRQYSRSELAKFDAKQAAGVLNPAPDRNESTNIGGGRRDDICDYGLSTWLRVKLLRDGLP